MSAPRPRVGAGLRPSSSQRGQDAGEGDDDGERGLARAEHQSLQRRHALPRHAIHTSHRRACSAHTHTHEVLIQLSQDADDLT